MSLRLSLVDGCRLDASVLVTPHDRRTLEPFAVEVVCRLLAGTTEEELCADAVATNGFDGLSQLYPLLFDLHASSLLRRDVLRRGEPFLSSVAVSASSRFGGKAIDPEGRHVLSRFAYLRRDGDHLVLESPRSTERLLVHGGEAAAFLSSLTHPLAVDDAAAFELLWQGNFLSRVDERGEALEDEEPSLVQWEFHDLLFHARSRFGRHLEGYGGSFRFRGKREPPAALSPREPGETVALFRPDVERLKQVDVPFSRVLEGRRSKRLHGEPPITVRQLGEFLYRALRVVEVVEGEAYEVARRVYPGGGAAYELEVYLAIGRCEGLDSGLYHYRPQEHRLTRLSDRTAEVERLLETAAHTVRVESPIQVLVLLGARFARMSWKYESMAYATVLKDVGVVYQTMYLVATAIGLAGCALGGGDADLFAAATGTDYYEESSVGEFVLGCAEPP